ncbi:metallophosphoesterase family protein [Natrinema salinisoli]|uniref:metallophosphoesterase family protein n=1 Tax=Natrinema salinisoli TaxID=2878535 RepID=UPI001CF08B8B|nr:metallophosphoesterase [Natrinema salinisoli]
MEVLCISDIQWEPAVKKTLIRLQNEIDEASPSLVLFGGDVINDGGNENEHVDEFIELLDYLEELGTMSFTIQGNHDEYSDYETIERHIEGLEYAEEISHVVAEFDGLKVLGLPYSSTHSLRTARQLSEEFSGSYDIVLAHAESSRRIWLFELDSRIVITGHYADRLCQVRDQAFVSMGSYPSDSVIINFDRDEVLYRREVESHMASQDRYEARVRLDDGELEWLRDEYDPDVFSSQPLQDSDYSDRFEALISAKDKVSETDDEGDVRMIIEGLLEAGIPKTHIREYIGRYDFL